MELSTQITPVSVTVEGAKRLDRQLSVVRVADSCALTACLALKGGVGRAIRESGAKAGLVDIATQAANGNYRPLAQMLAIRTGEPILISGKSTFEALPDMFKARIFQAQLGKNDGMRTVKKTGLLADGAKLALARELHGIVCKVTAYAAHVAAERKAERESITAE